MENDTVEVIELGIQIVILILGFGGIWYRLGKREQDQENMKADIAEVKEDVDAHDKKCVEREKEILKELTEGAKLFAKFGERIKHIDEDVGELKELFMKSLKK